VPAIYDPPFADDVPEVARRVGLSQEQVIAIHLAAEYQVYTIGYAPGMPYLGGVPQALHLPRREVPRPQVPAGAIMIGGVQAAIVPTRVPSAWYILGQTPLRPFDLGRRDPFLFRPGDRIRFRRIDRGEYEHLSELSSDALLPLVETAA
jgi:KipI family sensor histidine kinase inhibitor